MNYYKAKIQYAGTGYAGFQWQSGIQTIQHEFNNALAKIVNDKVTTVAASRTDTGVHALEQFIKITSALPIDCLSFVKQINQLLPKQIRCVGIETCKGDFRPTAKASSKEYRYFFTNQIKVKKEDGQFIANISNPLDLERMMFCIRAFVGEHDFCNFHSSGSNVKSTTRTIFSCELTKINPHHFFDGSALFPIPQDLHECYQLKIEANGFLKQMIRHIVSALWMVGSQKMTSKEFLVLLDGPKSTKQRWRVAPPNGLFLCRINYPNEN